MVKFVVLYPVMKQGVYIYPNEILHLFTVCLDGTLPGYHLHRGYGSGANSWLIQLEVCRFSFNDDI